MAYIRGHFYIWSSGEDVSFGHGNHVWDGEPIGGRVQGRTGRVEDNTLCGYAHDSSEPTNVRIPTYIVEEFCAMYWARMSSDDREAAVKRVVEKYGGGNFGADGVMEALGLDTVMDQVKKSLPEWLDEASG